jgi:uncharacterized protein (TIGR03083 family)
MEQPQPIIVAGLFPELLDNLLQLLSGLTADHWEKPTICGGWSVKDVALHLLGVEVGNLSWKRDHFSATPTAVGSADELVDFVNNLNESWIEATRRVSPRLLCGLLEFTGSQVCEYFASLDPYALGDPVSWAGPNPAPVWLDLAREYTERWHHQQHIRDAIGKPGLKEPRFLAPVIDTFVRALPHAYRDVKAAIGTHIALTISGESGGQWFVVREATGWSLYTGVAQQPDAEVVTDEDAAWKLFTKGLSSQQTQASVTVLGYHQLGTRVLDMLSIIA